MHPSGTKVAPRVALWAAIVAATIYSVFPFYWLFISSVTDSSALFSGALVPSHFSLDSYGQLFSQTAVLTWVLNSVLVAAAVTLLTVLVSVMGAYSLVFFNTRLVSCARNSSDKL